MELIGEPSLSLICDFFASILKEATILHFLLLAHVIAISYGDYFWCIYNQPQLSLLGLSWLLLQLYSPSLVIDFFVHRHYFGSFASSACWHWFLPSRAEEEVLESVISRWHTPNLVHSLFLSTNLELCTSNLELCTNNLELCTMGYKYPLMYSHLDWLWSCVVELSSFNLFLSLTLILTFSHGIRASCGERSTRHQLHHQPRFQWRFSFSDFRPNESVFEDLARVTPWNHCGLQLCRRNFFQIPHGFWVILRKLPACRISASVFCSSPSSSFLHSFHGAKGFKLAPYHPLQVCFWSTSIRALQLYLRWKHCQLVFPTCGSVFWRHLVERFVAMSWLHFLSKLNS